MKTLIVRDLKAEHKSRTLIDLEDWLPLLNNLKESDFKMINDFEVESSTKFSNSFANLVGKIKFEIEEYGYCKLNYAEIELLASESNRQTIWMELTVERDEHYLNLECFDYSYWIVRTNIQSFIVNVYSKFKNIQEKE